MFFSSRGCFSFLKDPLGSPLEQTHKMRYTARSSSLSRDGPVQKHPFLALFIQEVSTGMGYGWLE